MRWNPTPEQISVAVDCAVARVPLEKAAELIGVRPRTLRSFTLDHARVDQANTAGAKRIPCSKSLKCIFMAFSTPSMSR